jgi:hypothetical protein
MIENAIYVATEIMTWTVNVNANESACYNLNKSLRDIIIVVIATAKENTAKRVHLDPAVRVSLSQVYHK